MDLDFAAGRLITGTGRRVLTLMLAGMLVGLSMGIASPAQATPNVAKTWGYNGQGQLGNGTMNASEVPVLVNGLSGVSAATAGENHTLTLLEDGTVMAWGENAKGQLGDGTTEIRQTPVAVCVVAEVPCAPEHRLAGVVTISAGHNHNLALLNTGAVMEWGDGVRLPIERTGLGKVKAIAAGEGVSLALLDDGRVMSWGFNDSGQLGDGTTEESTVPVAVCAVGTIGSCPSGPYLEGVKAISAGRSDSFAVALLQNETVVAWGRNVVGELGDGTTENRDVPVAVKGLSEVTAISSGGEHTLALLKRGSVLAWGLNTTGQLGDGTTTGPETCGLSPTEACSKKPVLVGGLPTGATSLAAGHAHSMALLEGGAVYAWGNNATGQLGDGTTTGPEDCGFPPAGCSAKPVPVSEIEGAKGIAAGGPFSLAFGPPPTVTKLASKRGSAGTIVGITGTDFAGVTEVKFGSTSASSFEVFSPTFLFATAPEEPAGTVVNVTVTNRWGTSATSAEDLFTYSPAVTGVSPNKGPVAGGTSVTVTGSGFATGTTATKFKFGNKRATSVNCTSTTSCTAVSPAHEAGTVDVKAIVNKQTSARNRPADQFTYS